MGEYYLKTSHYNLQKNIFFVVARGFLFGSRVVCMTISYWIIVSYNNDAETFFFLFTCNRLALEVYSVAQLIITIIFHQLRNKFSLDVIRKIYINRHQWINKKIKCVILFLVLGKYLMMSRSMSSKNFDVNRNTYFFFSFHSPHFHGGFYII